MKRIFTGLVSVTLAGAAFLMMNGCKREAGNAPVATSSFKSAETNSFQEVTSKLDAGGNLYLYLSTEQWLKNLSDTVGKYRDAVNALPDMGEDAAAVTNGFNV